MNWLTDVERWRMKNGLCMECGRWVDKGRSRLRCRSCADAQMAKAQEKRYMKEMRKELEERAANKESIYQRYSMRSSCPRECRRCEFATYVSTATWFCPLPVCKHDMMDDEEKLVDAGSVF